MEKTYKAHLNKLDIEASGLLGFFDSDNQYIIENDIIQELILANKLIESYENDKITATAKVGEYKLNFNIYLQEGEGNKKRAGLFVVEKCKLEFASVVQTYVDSFVGQNNSEFFIELKKRFHLFAVDESEGIDMANSALTKIMNKKADLTKKYKAYIPLMMDADMAYVKKMLALIKTTDKYGPEFLQNLKRMIDEKGLHKASPNYWREVRILLDKMLIQNQTLFKQEILSKMDKIQEEYVKLYESTKEPKQEKVTLSKKKKASKPADLFVPKTQTVKGSFTPTTTKKEDSDKSKDNPEPSSRKYVKVSITRVKKETVVEGPSYEMFGGGYENKTITHVHKETTSATKIKVEEAGRDM